MIGKWVYVKCWKSPYYVRVYNVDKDGLSGDYLCIFNNKTESVLGMIGRFPWGVMTEWRIANKTDMRKINKALKGVNNG